MKNIFAVLILLFVILLSGCNTALNRVIQGRWVLLYAESHNKNIFDCINLNLINFDNNTVFLEGTVDTIDLGCKVYKGLSKLEYNIFSKDNRYFLKINGLNGDTMYNGIYKIRFNVIEEENNVYCELKSEHNRFILRKYGYRQLYFNDIKKLKKECPKCMVE